MILAAWKQAWRCYTSQLPDMLRYTLLMLVLHLMPLAPALCLLDKAMHPGALACAVLFVLLILPLRQNAAVMMQYALRGERIYHISLVSVEDYGRKLMRGLKRMVLLLAWASPALAATAAGMVISPATGGVQGVNDAFTLLNKVRTTFGEGDLFRGVINLALCYAATWLPLMVGCAFHSGARHAYALGDKRLLRGHRLGQMAAWLFSAVTLLPWLVCVGIAVAGYVPELLEAVKRYSFDTVASPAGTLMVIGAATCVLMVPVLPLRDLILAAYAAQVAQNKEQGGANA